MGQRRRWEHHRASAVPVMARETQLFFLQKKRRTMASGDRAIRRCAWGGLGKSGQPRFLAWTGVHLLRVALVEKVLPGSQCWR